MTSKLSLLVPQPQEIMEGIGGYSLPGCSAIRIDGDDNSQLFAAQWLQRKMADHGIDAAITARSATVDGDIVLASKKLE